MSTLLTIVHIVVSLFLIVIVLLQHGKGASMGASFGGSSQTVFGTEGPLPLLNKITTWAAIVFMLTSISLAYMSTRIGDGSVMKEVAPIAKPQNAPIPLPAADGAVPLAPGHSK
ncbi:MAG: preprotein translocase subunit SecG [Deltaproteobacteria bacterium RIFOXYD12_FULL_55_16]|nr:MAG: preprotein translocase subunit SecG [Deltaproteobacteria bacterium RIFOXYD12_FULL_55_16]